MIHDHLQKFEPLFERRPKPAAENQESIRNVLLELTACIDRLAGLLEARSLVPVKQKGAPFRDDGTPFDYPDA